jgi:hypothetical protein
MAEDVKKLTTKNTKQEMLEAYKDLVQKFEERRQAELQPEKEAEEQKTRRAIEQADKLSLDGISQGIGQLKSEINKTFTDLVEKLEIELAKYQEVKKAITAKENELEEIYEIQKSASSLAALIEAQNQRRKEFEREMEEKKQTLATEIEATRQKWETEKVQYEVMVKEKQEADDKQHRREKEEYEYNFKREQKLARDKFEDEKSKAEKTLAEQKEQTERELTEREKIIAEREKKIASFEQRINELEQTRDKVVDNAIKELTERLNADFQAKETLFKKEFEGERKVFSTRIQSLEATVKDQNERITLLNQQLEKASTQVQDIAVKAIEGSSHSKLLNQLQSYMEEKSKKENEVKVKNEK